MVICNIFSYFQLSILFRFLLTKANFLLRQSRSQARVVKGGGWRRHPWLLISVSGSRTKKRTIPSKWVHLYHKGKIHETK